MREVLEQLGLSLSNHGIYSDGAWHQGGGEEVISFNPATEEPLGGVSTGTAQDVSQVVEAAHRRFLHWRMVPPPVRGEAVRCLGQRLRELKKPLGMLVTLESGKILSEGLGEVQEMIDMCDFAVGLSRQLYGLTIASERPQHRMFEQWHPLGVVGVITAFNFPVAVWAWNAALAVVCGDPVVWKPSTLSPLCAVAVMKICQQIERELDCPGVFHLCVGSGQQVGEPLVEHPRVALISATGSCRMGLQVAQCAAKRLARTLLELGGNNAVILTPHANLDLALRAVVFAAVGTAGQRCTTLRRLIVHESVWDRFVPRLVEAYQSIRIGDPWEPGVLMGPLISAQAVEQMQSALQQAQAQGGRVLWGGEVLSRPGHFVRPALVEADPQMSIVAEETFAPILYLIPYQRLEQAIEIHNSVPQGLSSAIFTDNLQEAELFLSAQGSDCGIANVNVGTSGAEIGGAFGGEKLTGGGREAGSDAWRAYMRRQTCTINWGRQLPLAQGVQFPLPAQ